MIRFTNPFLNPCIFYLFVIHITPMFLVPMPGRGYSGKLFSEFLISFWRHLQCQSGLRILHIMLTTAQPKAYENLPFQTEGEDVIAKRLVFCHAVEGQGVVSYLLDVHLWDFFRCKDTHYFNSNKTSIAGKPLILSDAPAHQHIGLHPAPFGDLDQSGDIEGLENGHLRHSSRLPQLKSESARRVFRVNLFLHCCCFAAKVQKKPQPKPLPRLRILHGTLSNYFNVSYCSSLTGSSHSLLAPSRTSLW